VRTEGHPQRFPHDAHSEGHRAFDNDILGEAWRQHSPNKGTAEETQPAAENGDN
jgi:hypothetical protein